MKIGILTAMDKEFSMIESSFNLVANRFSKQDNFLEGIHGKNYIVASTCGIGKVNAAMTATQMLEKFNVDLIISTGCAGSINEEFAVNDIVVAESCRYWDVYCGEECAKGQVQGEPKSFVTNNKYLSLVKDCGCKTTNFVSGDMFVNEKVAKGILEDFPIIFGVVDMESASIAHVCNKYHKDFVSMRIISDVVIKKNNYKQYKKFWETAHNKSFDTLVSFINKL